MSSSQESSSASSSASRPDRRTIASVERKLIAAQSLMMSAGHWRNKDGYLTDGALWIYKALEELAEALLGDGLLGAQDET